MRYILETTGPDGLNNKCQVARENISDEICKRWAEGCVQVNIIEIPDAPKEYKHIIPESITATRQFYDELFDSDDFPF